MWENDNKNSYNSKYNSLIIKYIIQFDTSKLNRRNHYNEYQKKLFDEVKYLKDEVGLGYRRISYLLYEKGYRGIRKRLQEVGCHPELVPTWRGTQECLKNKA